MRIGLKKRPSEHKNTRMKKTLLLLTCTLFLFLAGCNNSTEGTCTSVTCLNNGVPTEDCGCDCPDGYTGVDCAALVTPTTVTIVKVTLKNFPNETIAGDYWDGFPIVGSYTYPDLMVRISKGTTTIFESDILDDMVSTGDCSDAIEFTTAAALTDLSSQYNLTLLDDDAIISSSDVMGTFLFEAYNAANGFPETMVITSCNEAITLEISLTYTW